MFRCVLTGLVEPSFYNAQAATDYLKEIRDEMQRLLDLDTREEHPRYYCLAPTAGSLILFFSVLEAFFLCAPVSNILSSVNVGHFHSPVTCLLQLQDSKCVVRREIPQSWFGRLHPELQLLVSSGHPERSGTEIKPVFMLLSKFGIWHGKVNNWRMSGAGDEIMLSWNCLTH